MNGDITSAALCHSQRASKEISPFTAGLGSDRRRRRRLRGRLRSSSTGGKPSTPSGATDIVAVVVRRVLVLECVAAVFTIVVVVVVVGVVPVSVLPDSVRRFYVYIGSLLLFIYVR